MGHVVTQETRVKLSIAHKGKIGPWAGKQKTKEQITNIKKIYCVCYQRIRYSKTTKWSYLI
jgi:hypothetical protein